MVGVEQWAEIRRLHFVKGLSQREIRRRTGLHRNTVRNALNSSEPPVYRRAPGSKLDPLKEEIHRLLKEDPKLPGVRIRELLGPLGCTASKTVVDEEIHDVAAGLAICSRKRSYWLGTMITGIASGLVVVFAPKDKLDLRSAAQTTDWPAPLNPARSTSSSRGPG